MSGVKEGTIDVTARIEVYEKGKTFECDCGQGFGVEKNVRMVKCPSCNSLLEDEKAELREDMEIDRPEEKQMTMDDFL